MTEGPAYAQVDCKFVTQGGSAYLRVFRQKAYGAYRHKRLECHSLMLGLDEGNDNLQDCDHMESLSSINPYLLNALSSMSPSSTLLLKPVVMKPTTGN